MVEKRPRFQSNTWRGATHIQFWDWSMTEYQALNEKKRVHHSRSSEQIDSLPTHSNTEIQFLFENMYSQIPLNRITRDQ